MAAGCGGGSLAPDTTPLGEGTQVSPQRYLADTDAAGAAVAEFTRDLTTVGNVATPEALTRAAPALRATLQDAEALSQRLSAERVEDTRLEAQRARAADRPRGRRRRHAPGHRRRLGQPPDPLRPSG